MNRQYPSHKQQQGMSLLVVLILLVVMSILGVAVMRSSSMQERMAANLRDRSLATQAAEAALAAAQDYLNTNTKWRTTVPDATTCTNDSVCPTFTKKTAATWHAGPQVGGTNGVPKTTTDYWIEYLGENQTSMEIGGVIPSSETVTLGPLFRITARSQSVGRAAVTLQTDVIYRFQRL